MEGSWREAKSIEKRGYSCKGWRQGRKGREVLEGRRPRDGVRKGGGEGVDVE